MIKFNSDINAAQQQINSSLYDLNSAKSAWYPNLSFYNYNYPTLSKEFSYSKILIRIHFD